MAKELYIYSGIYDFTAEGVVKDLNTVSDDENLTIRFNTPGGSPDAGWSMISKLSERKTPTNGIIDGKAMSMGAMMLPFLNHVVANDTSRIMFHKAAYPAWREPSEAENKELKNINSIFRVKLEAKVLGKTKGQEFINKVFEPDVRNDVSLSPHEAMELGIVNEVRTLEPAAYAFDAEIVALAEEKTNKSPESRELNNNQNNNSMNLDEFKSKHPDLYAQVKTEGHEAGVLAEKDRGGSWLAFNDIDPEAVAKGIKDGEILSQTAIAEFTRKGIAQARSEDHADDNAEGTKTGGDQKTEAKLKAEAQEKEANESLEKHNIK